MRAVLRVLLREAFRLRLRCWWRRRALEGERVARFGAAAGWLSTLRHPRGGHGRVAGVGRHVRHVGMVYASDGGVVGVGAEGRGMRPGGSWVGR